MRGNPIKGNKEKWEGNFFDTFFEVYSVKTPVFTFSISQEKTIDLLIHFTNCWSNIAVDGYKWDYTPYVSHTTR